MSKRKPFNENAGYIASRRNELNRGWVVIYRSDEAGIDVGAKYAVVCELHGTMTGVSSVQKARRLLKYPDFCEQCALDYVDCLVEHDGGEEVERGKA